MENLASAELVGLLAGARGDRRGGERNSAHTEKKNVFGTQLETVPGGDAAAGTMIR